jgi:acetyl esterase/lipase
MKYAWMGLMVLAVVSVARAQTSRPALLDLPYRNGEISDYEKERCKIDLYLPDVEVKNFRTIVWFHGGALEGGAKTDRGTRGLALAFKEQGVAVAVAEYRLSPKVKYPSYLDDAAASVAWTLANIEQHGGDPKNVFIGGHSAGGYLAAAIGFDAKYLSKYGVSTNQIAGLVPMSPQVFTHFTIRKENGVKDAEKIPVIDEAAPAYHVRADAPRTFVPVGDNDWPARLEECQYFIAMLQKVVKHPDASMQVFANRNHGTILNKAREPGDPTMVAMLAFIRREAITTQPTTQPSN